MTNIHLLVIIHGMWGNPGHVAELARIVLDTHPVASSDGTVLHVLNAESIRDNSTYDGVDWGGERVAKEVIEAVGDLERKGVHVVRFSVTGYSMGGLVARYLVGVLYHAGFFENITPVNFSTIATPHAGVPRYPSFLSSASIAIGTRLLSRTGEQFFCADKWSPSGRPLLVVMADPDRIFHQSLSRFKHIRIYANTINDTTVPFVTAALEMADPFVDLEASGIQIEMDEEYPHLIRDYTISPTPPQDPDTTTWYKRLRPKSLRFPWNLVLYTSLPVLVPLLVSLVVVRFAIAARSSRARIRLLEEEAHTAGQRNLADILAELEREVGETVVDLIDKPATSDNRGHPIITPNHRKIVDWLNLLPIKKKFAYFPGVRNSHPIIVCRDVKYFESQRQGEDVVKHWANSFIL